MSFSNKKIPEQSQADDFTGSFENKRAVVVDMH